MLEDLEKEVKMYKSWQREAEQLGQDENLLEIREPYNEEEENKWREKHRDRVKQEKQQSLSNAANSSSTGGNESNSQLSGKHFMMSKYFKSYVVFRKYVSFRVIELVQHSN